MVLITIVGCKSESATSKELLQAKADLHLERTNLKECEKRTTQTCEVTTCPEQEVKVIYNNTQKECPTCEVKECDRNTTWDFLTLEEYTKMSVRIKWLENRLNEINDSDYIRDLEGNLTTCNYKFNLCNSTLGKVINASTY